jgi:bifunctional DNA-binding transcriptional regulator/antitoxin component of YhaV-PrlF toxin-antitoxin module
MLVTITAKRQVTFPAQVLNSLGVQPGESLELVEGPDGFLLCPHPIEPSRLAPLRGRLKRGQGTFALDTFRDESHEQTLRD